ncbi:hypothetical protein ACFSJS_22495 [Streptomyces desertarenae]|uniref:MarR family transcriptional regulator n=1 Tax=Streptomyces desertarenae TaxID=2666184 RepID=A0ABW4PNV2_9ACTN
MPETTGHEWWTAAQVADHLGIQPGSVRRQMSRWGITREYVPSSNGRPEARYDAAEVRAAHAARPGRGARTDLPSTA